MVMELPDDALTDRCEGYVSEIDRTHYAEIPLDQLQDGKTMRIWPHRDFFILILSAQGSTSGLQIEGKTQLESFVGVLLVDRTELLINVGDMLDRWTHERILTGLHQVGILDDVKDNTFSKRYSVALPEG